MNTDSDVTGANASAAAKAMADKKAQKATQRKGGFNHKHEGKGFLSDLRELRVLRGKMNCHSTRQSVLIETL